MNVARSPQKYVNIFFSQSQIFHLSPPIFDMTVEARCQVHRGKINGSILCLTGFYISGSNSPLMMMPRERNNEAVMRMAKYCEGQSCFIGSGWWVAVMNNCEL